MVSSRRACHPSSNLPFVLLNPLLGRVMRSVRCTGRVVDEEWLVGRHRLLKLDPLDRLGRHVGGEVIVFLSFFGTRVTPSKMTGSHWLVSPPMKP